MGTVYTLQHFYIHFFLSFARWPLYSLLPLPSSDGSHACAALGDEEYETNRLRRLFSAFECVAELNADLLKNTVSEVLVTRQNVKLRLKNGQVIERSDLQ